jgi:hypothetical protein
VGRGFSQMGTREQAAVLHRRLLGANVICTHDGVVGVRAAQGACSDCHCLPPGLCCDRSASGPGQDQSTRADPAWRPGRVGALGDHGTPHRARNSGCDPEGVSRTWNRSIGTSWSSATRDEW